MGHWLEVINDAGVDASRHRLVTVRCLRCKRVVEMRKSKVGRNKSCGCLKADLWHKRQVDNKRRKEAKPVTTKGSSFWAQWDDSNLTPAQICAMASKQGTYST